MPGITYKVTASSITHSELGGLSSDDHTQYTLLAGRSGGQEQIGGTDANDNYTIESTSNATKGVIQCKDPVEIRTEKALKFMDADNSNFISFKSPSVVASDIDFTLPSTDGTVNQVLKTDGNKVLGWASVTIDSSGDIDETSFSAANNQVAAADVTGLAFANGTVRSFRASVSISIDATANLFEHVELMGIQRDSDWLLTSSAVGDTTNIVFSITSAGQIQYTSGNETGFVSNTMKFRAWVTTL